MTCLYSVAQTLTRLTCVLLFRMRAFGVENVPRRGRVVLASNHQSFLDPVLVGVPPPRELRYMGRQSLFRPPAFAWLLRGVGTFPVQRGSADLKAIRAGIEMLRAGQGLVLFPEGTRSPDGRIRPFRPGFALLAARAEAPIVPAAVDGAFAAWPRHRKLPRAGRVCVRYGEPLPPPSSGRAAVEAAAAEVERRVRARPEQLRSNRR